MTEFIEASTPFGGFLVAVGVALMLLNATQAVFASWLWAVVVCGAWVAFGSLLLYPDVRLYQYDESPTEALLQDEARATTGD